MFKPILGALAGLMLAVSPAVAQSEAEAPAIWAMSDEDRTVYLLGTIKLSLCIEFAWLKARLRSLSDLS